MKIYEIMIKIQISNPTLLGIKDDNDYNIEEAIETVFPSDTEYAFLIWDDIFIPLSYKYDISKMINDFILLEKFIYSNNKKIDVYWASNTFSSIWKLQKNGNNINIKSKWNCVLGNLTDILNVKFEIVVDINQFSKEIKKMLVFIRLALYNSGYDKNLVGYNELDSFV